MNNWWKSGVVAIVWACLLGSVLAPSIAGAPAAYQQTNAARR
jgi:hypothetical protein